MKERPIIMQAESVRAILDGRKTQTRRVLVMPKGHSPLEEYHHLDMLGTAVFTGGTCVRCPHGQPGDRLWVREQVELSVLIGDWAASCYSADGQPTVADAWPWKTNHLSPLFMPRGLSRITLELVNVRVERVQDISEDDARSEGVKLPDYDPDWRPSYNDPDSGGNPSYIMGYEWLWDSIHGKNPARCWAANPLVWVLEFKRVTP